MNIRTKKAAAVLLCLLLGSYGYAQVDQGDDEAGGAVPDGEAGGEAGGKAVEKKVVVKTDNEPDFTKVEALPDKNNKTSSSYAALGPSGIIGNIWKGKSPTTMIQVREVIKGTPADGKIEEGDVIVGIGSDKFSSDVRRAVSAAITEAEKKENNGKLVLNVWRKRDKKVLPVTLTIPVMGTYSATAPWDCPKTEAIIDEAAEWLAEHMPGGIAGNVAALGLLATGEKKYERIVRERAQNAAKKPSGGPWDAGYELIMMSEYYLASNDSSVKSGIREQAEHIARGQSKVGTYGHGFATGAGTESGYGCMNQAGISCVLGMVLAQKCGINSPEVDKAVALGTAHLRWYVDKGVVPYGYHRPNTRDYDNNGRNSQCAVLFDIYGDKEAAEFFTRCTVASYKIREGGHTGNYWSWLWGAPGAARGGPEAAHSFVENTRWFTELERRHKSEFHYQPQLGGRDHGKYLNWDTTGARLLQLCLPRKAIYITGKGGSSFPPLSGDRLKETLDVVTFDPDKLSESQLLESLGSWSYKVRWDAAIKLGKCDQDVSQKLITMLDSPERQRRYGACIGLRWAGREKNFPKIKDKMLGIIESSDDQCLQYYAVNALRYNPWDSKHNLKEEVRKAAPELMKLAAKLEAECNDPFNKITAEIIESLWYGGHLADFRSYSRWGGIKPSDFDDKVLLPAIAAGLRSPDGGTRSSAASWLHALNEKQLDQIWSAIWSAATTSATGNTMFGRGGMTSSKDALGRGRFKEGMETALETMRKPGWGAFATVPAAFRTLSSYGEHLKPYLPEMEKVYQGFVKSREPQEVKDMERSWAMVQENIGKKVELRSIKDFIKDEPKKTIGVKNLAGKNGTGKFIAVGTVAGKNGSGAAGTATTVGGKPEGRPPAPEVEKETTRIARTVSPENRELLDRALKSALTKLNDSGSLKERAVQISTTRAKVWLKEVADEKLTFQIVGGTQTAIFEWEDLGSTDRATLAMLAAALKPDSRDAQAMAAVYLESFGRLDEADPYYEKAGEESRKKLEQVFEQQ